MRKIPDNVLTYIKEELERVQYGKVTIELKETSEKIDIITEQRKRFIKKGENDSNNKNVEHASYRKG